MNFLEDVHKKINDLKVTNYKEEILNSHGNFIQLKKGTYKLNNNKIIKREIIVKKVGTGNASAIFAVKYY